MTLTYISRSSYKIPKSRVLKAYGAYLVISEHKMIFCDVENDIMILTHFLKVTNACALSVKVAIVRPSS